MIDRRKPVRGASALLVSASLIACTVPKPSAARGDVWSGRVSPEILAAVDSRRIRFAGGDGTSVGSPVIIVGASDSGEGVPAEYLWIARRHGVEGRDWRLRLQRLTGPDARGRLFDVLTIEVAGERSGRTYYFDITEFFGAPRTSATAG